MCYESVGQLAHGRIGGNNMGEINEKMKPWSITQAELDLRWDYMYGKITLRTFNRRFNKLKKQGKIIRDGKAIK